MNDLAPSKSFRLDQAAKSVSRYISARLEGSLILLPLHDADNICEYVRELEAENADLRLKVEELGALCKRKTRQCCHKDRIISSLDLENSDLKRQLQEALERY